MGLSDSLVGKASASPTAAILSDVESHPTRLSMHVHKYMYIRVVSGETTVFSERVKVLENVTHGQRDSGQMQFDAHEQTPSVAFSHFHSSFS